MNQALVGAAAVGAVLLIEQKKKAPGTSLAYVANYMRARGQIGGVAFAVPEVAGAVDVFSAMKDAQRAAWGAQGGDPNVPSGSALKDICQAWLDAYAGACGQGHGAASGSVFASDAYNFSMLRQRLGGSAVPPTCSTDACSDDKLAQLLSPVGQAICELQAYTYTLDTIGADYASGAAIGPYIPDVYTRVENVARALDGIDYVAPGTRPSDSLAGFGDLVGSVLGYLTPALVVVAVAAVVAWKVLK